MTFSGRLSFRVSVAMRNLMNLKRFLNHCPASHFEMTMVCRYTAWTWMMPHKMLAEESGVSIYYLKGKIGISS